MPRVLATSDCFSWCVNIYNYLQETINIKWPGLPQSYKAQKERYNKSNQYDINFYKTTNAQHSNFFNIFTDSFRFHNKEIAE